MRSLLSYLLLAVFAGYAALCLAAYLRQDGLLYFPQPRAIQSAESTLRLSRPDAELVITVRPLRSAKALIYFGGNAEDVSLGLAELSAAFPGHALYLPHYRGYGGSTGKPKESALFEDAVALFDHLHGAHEEISVIGRSLGSGMAVYLASTRPVNRMVLITPYDSMAAVAQHHFPYLPVRWLLRDRFESLVYAPQVTAPTTVIEAERDEIIPRKSTENLFASFRPGVASYHRIAGADHNSVSLDPSYYPLLKGR